VWVKIQSDGFSGGKWGVDRIRKNGGMQSVTFPRVAAGEYLIRPEILALHEGNRVGGAQFYMACIQFKTSGPGSVGCISVVRHGVLTCIGTVRRNCDPRELQGN
jgi:lytic cellulose monooxygenase (C1-hydroxylating)